MTVANFGFADLIGLLVAVGVFSLVWTGALVRRDASLVDRFWGPGFVLVAAFWAVTAPAPNWGVVALVALWGLRLGAYLTWRNWGQGEDKRYAAMRAKAPRRFPWTSLVTVFWLQAAILWLIAQPLAVAVRAGDGALSWGHPLALLGLAVWLAGFAFESVADGQMARFKRDPANKGKVFDRGLWRYSRHPNYFGEILVWWGLWLVAASAGGWWSVFAPILLTALLVKVSGVTLLEKDLAASKPAYAAYRQTTNALIPGPPRRRNMEAE